MASRHIPTLILGLLLLVCIPMRANAQEPAYEGAPIHYSKSRAVTPLTKIRDRIAKGEDLLSGRSDQDILIKLLKLLDIPLESQVLAFSKTSQQNIFISARTPRAIYFSDNAYVAWVQKGDIEVITFDPNLGMVFHLLTISNGEANETIKFIRRTSCLSCHGSKATQNWPGLTIRSVHASRSGEPNLRAKTFRTNHASPLHERWGGWYITGNAGQLEHRGNSIDHYDTDPEKATLEKLTTKPLDTLTDLFPTAPYPGGPYSDIVALMVLEHQLTVHNALVQGHLAIRIDSSEPTIKAQATKIVEALLFKAELKLTNPITGSKKFQTAFKSKDTPLKEFDLKERLFKHRCSYLIYSDAFTHLPKKLRDQVLKDIELALTQDLATYAYLGAREKLKLHQTLSETMIDYN